MAMSLPSANDLSPSMADDRGAGTQTLSQIATGCLPVEPSGTAFFVTDRRAVTALANVPSRWRESPAVKLAVPARVVAEHQALGIALLETDAPATGLGPVSAGADPRTAAIPAAEISNLIAFYVKACAQPRDPNAAVYITTVEGTFLRGLGPLVTPALKARLLELKIDFAGLRASYSREVWNRALAITVAELFPGRPHEEGYRKLGELSFRGLRHMPGGAPVAKIAQWVGPRGSILRLPEGCSSVNNYMKMTLEELAPNHFRLHLNETHGCPAYTQGAIEEALTVGGARDLHVAIHAATAEAVCFDVRWSPDE
jgi:uncharacterized protein (TIGR02265 family)